jgi:LysM repeat protein
MTMKGARPVLTGLALALVSAALVLGGLSLSLAEGNMLPPTATPSPSKTPTWAPFTAPPVSTSTPLLPSETPTLPPPPTTCPRPLNWIPYQVQPGDTLEGLAQRYRSDPNLLAQNNCLLTSSLPIGSVLYVPPVPVPTATPCRPPRGWVLYTVQRGEWLYRIAERYGINYQELMAANCMNSTTIYAGQQLYVPPWPPHTSTSTLTPTITLTGTATMTSTSTPSLTASLTVPPSATPTASSTPTATGLPSETPTFTATETPTESPSPTPTTPSP